LQTCAVGVHWLSGYTLFAGQHLKLLVTQHQWSHPGTKLIIKAKPKFLGAFAYHICVQM